MNVILQLLLTPIGIVVALFIGIPCLLFDCIFGTEFTYNVERFCQWCIFGLLD